jgi:hypothetical protein
MLKDYRCTAGPLHLFSGSFKKHVLPPEVPSKLKEKLHKE